jgi:diadenosine tetraphosphate (Ap4A) HIT family hydrolase
MSLFDLHPNLLSKIFLIDLPLCRVLLEDERHYPWLLLVPRRPQISRIMELSLPDQWQFMRELDAAQRILWSQFHPAQLNVAAIGNRTPQLHVHLIARQLDDPAWPGTVWDHSVRASYLLEERQQRVALLQNNFSLMAQELQALT